MLCKSFKDLTVPKEFSFHSPLLLLYLLPALVQTDSFLYVWAVEVQGQQEHLASNEMWTLNLSISSPTSYTLPPFPQTVQMHLSGTQQFLGLIQICKQNATWNLIFRTAPSPRQLTWCWLTKRTRSHAWDKQEKKTKHEFWLFCVTCNLKMRTTKRKQWKCKDF